MDWKELFNALLPLILSAMGVVFTAVGTYLALQVKKFLDTKEKRSLAEVTVKYVEQVGKVMGSDEKFKLAKETLIQELNNQGITFTEVELEVLIESVVNGFKKEYAKVDEPKKEEVKIDEQPLESIGSE